MTTTLQKNDQNTNREHILDYLAKISGNTPLKINKLFEKFEINTGFNGHQNLINEILSISSHHSVDTIFSTLELFQNLCDTFSAYKDADLTLAATQGTWNNPVKHVRKRPIAALTLMDKNPKDKNFDPVFVLSQLIILAVFSDLKKNNDHIKRIAEAANQLRSLIESDTPLSVLSEFDKKLTKIYYFNELVDLISNNTDIRSNSKAISIFNSINRILDLIPNKGLKHHTVIKQKAFQESDDITNHWLPPPVIFSQTEKPNKEPENETLVYVNDTTEDIHDIEEEEISEDLLKILPSINITEITNELSETKTLSALYQPAVSPSSYRDTSFCYYAKNLHNIIERQWLKSALISPETINSDDATALCIGLSICTSINYRDVLGFSIGEHGHVTPDGFYKRKIPDSPNAVTPDDSVKHLYLPHINDIDNSSINLPLPDFIKIKLQKLIPFNNKCTLTIRDLFINNTKKPEDLIKGFIQELNKIHGQRFNTNRVSCQLKQYIKSYENDACISYALFGTDEQKTPTAFYYRSIELNRLISIYKKYSEQYFDEII